MKKLSLIITVFCFFMAGADIVIILYDIPVKTFLFGNIIIGGLNFLALFFAPKEVG